MPLTQCKQPFAAMDSHLRANVKSMIQENMTKYGLVFAAVTEYKCDLYSLDHSLEHHIFLFKWIRSRSLEKDGFYVIFLLY